MESNDICINSPEEVADGIKLGTANIAHAEFRVERGDAEIIAVKADSGIRFIHFEDLARTL